MTILLSEIYDVTLKRNVRNAAKAGFIRPTIGESFVTNKDFVENSIRELKMLFNNETDYIQENSNFTDFSDGAIILHEGIVSFSEKQKVNSTDKATNDYLGARVALDGDTAVISAPYEGSPLNSGSLYTFTRTAGIWTQQQKFTATGLLTQDKLGLKGLAIKGDVIVATTEDSDPGGNTNWGAAYIFTKTAGVWSQVQKLVPPHYGYFGCSAAISDDGNTIVIGAFGTTATQDNCGSVYVYVRTSATNWNLQQELLPVPQTQIGYVGFSVAISGETIIAGGYRGTINGYAVAGEVHVWTRSGTVWTHQQRIIHPFIGTSSYFGYAVAIEGDTAIISATMEFVSGKPEVFYYTRTGTVWTYQQKITPAMGGAVAATDAFGVCVKVLGDKLLIGSYFEWQGPIGGAVHIYIRSNNVWTFLQKITNSDPLVNDYFGYWLDMDSSSILVGAPAEDPAGLSAAGSTYYFENVLSNPLLPYYITTSDFSQKDTTLWSKITSVVISETTPVNTSIKYLVSFDGRVTWKYWNGSAWTLSSLANLQTNSMSKATLEALTYTNWAASGGFIAGTTTKLDFAMDLATTNSTVSPSLESISVYYSL